MPGVVASERRLIRDSEDLFKREVLPLSSGVVVGDSDGCKAWCNAFRSSREEDFLTP